jgi:hypothetical protein
MISGYVTKICKKAAQDFHRAVSKVFDRVKSVALWSANIRKLTKDHTGYGSAAMYSHVCQKILKYTFYTIKSSLALAYYVAFWSCDTVRKLMRQTTQEVSKHCHGRKG